MGKMVHLKARKLAQRSKDKAQKAIVISPFQLFCNAADWVFSAESVIILKTEKPLWQICDVQEKTVRQCTQDQNQN